MGCSVMSKFILCEVSGVVDNIDYKFIYHRAERFLMDEVGHFAFEFKT